MSKSGLPTGVQMRHDLHYVEELSREAKPVGKVIPIERIQPNPDQPRTEIGDLTELSASIKEKGVLEPLLVLPNSDGGYMIIAGERRYRASMLAGLTEVPCIEVKTDEQGVAEIALIENLQRKDLNIWEEADGLKALADRFGYTQDQIAQKISKSRTTVTELVAIAGLPAGIREKCRANDISAKSTLLEIARQFDEKEMSDFLDGLITGTVVARTKQSRNDGVATSRPLKKPGEIARPGRKFRYVSSDPAFRLDLHFETDDDLERVAVLKALKTAFEAVKSGQAEI